MESGSGGRQPTHCLICRKVVDGQGEELDLLEQQLRVIYVVSKLLEIPQHFTTRLLAEYGNHGQWTAFCAQCHTLVTQGEEIFREIQQLEKKHQKVRNMVRLAMQVKPEIEEDSICEVDGAATEIREFLETLDHVAADEEEQGDGEDDLFTPALLSPSSVSSFENDPAIAIPCPSFPPTRRSQRLIISNPNNRHKEEESSDVEYGDGDGDAYSPSEDEDRDDDDELSFSDADEDFRPQPQGASTNKYGKKRLTFQEVLQVHKDFTEKLLPLSKTVSKEEKAQRKRDAHNLSVGALVRLNRIKEFPCQTCPQVFSIYIDWVGHTHFEGCDQNPNHSVKKCGVPVAINKIKCDECGKLLGSRLSLEDHYRACHSHKDIQICSGCNLNFAETLKYRKHLSSSSDCLKFGLKCEECPVVRNSVDALALHKRIYHLNPPADPYQCLVCKKSFKMKGRLTTHMIKSHTPKDQQQFKCDRPGCTRVFWTAPDLKYHIQQVHFYKENPDAPTFPCDLCGKVFPARSYLSDHKRRVDHENPKYLCAVCGKSFKAQTSLTFHSRKCHSAKKATPTPMVKVRRKCPKKSVANKKPLLTFQEILQVHKDFTEKLLPLPDTASKEEFLQRRRDTQKHSVNRLVTANQVKEFQCQTCPQVFSTFQNWMRHTHFEGCDLNPEHSLKKSKARVEINKIKCEDCGKLVGSRWSLESHFRGRHSPKEIQLCRGCNQSYPEYSTYQSHYYATLKSNSGSDCVKFGFKCEEPGCHKVVRNSEEALELHRKIHHLNPPPDPCRCIQCDRTFASKALLHSHILRRHTPKEEWPFKCDRPGCSTRCINASELKNHLKQKHDLNKEQGAYPCDVCGKGFALKGHLVRHKKLHKPDNPYLCPVCGKSFKLQEYLAMHSWTHDPKVRKERYDRYRDNKVNKKRKQEGEEKSH